MRRTRLKKSKLHKHLKRWKLYTGLIILAWVFIYIVILGTISFAKQLFSIHVYAPTHKVYAKEIIPTPTPVQLNPDLTEREQNIYLIKKIWGKDQEIGLAIAKCESGYQTKIVNSIGATGIFQVMPLHGIPDMTNAVANISYSYSIYLKQGLAPWYSSKGCWGN